MSAALCHGGLKNEPLGLEEAAQFFEVGVDQLATGTENDLQDHIRMAAVPGFRERDLAEDARAAAGRKLCDVRAAVEQGLAFGCTVDGERGAMGAQALADFGEGHPNAHFGFEFRRKGARGRGAGGDGEQGNAGKEPVRKRDSGWHDWLAGTKRAEYPMPCCAR